VRVEEAVMPAISPNVEGRQPNAYDKTDEACLFAIAEAMREEAAPGRLSSRTEEAP
jgi:hypothetical protein